MRKVGISELRKHLPRYLTHVRQGEPIQVTQRGKVVARLVPEQSAAVAARERIVALRKTAKLGDVISPLKESWGAARGAL